MAAWQFELFVIPQRSPLPEFKGDGWDLPPRPLELASSIKASLAEWLGMPRVLFESTFYFGEEQGNRVDFSTDDEGFELSVRLDAGRPNDEFLVALSRLVRSLDSVLFAPESATRVEPDSMALSQALKQSLAARFCASPGNYFGQFGDAG